MATGTLCGLKPLFSHRKPSRFEMDKSAHQPKNQKKESNGTKMEHSRRCTSNFFLMMELRKKIFTFRDIIDLPPCDGTESINELVTRTIKDLYKLQPEIISRSQLSELKEASIGKVLIYFCEALRNIGDSWTMTQDWMDKVASDMFNNIDKLNSENIVEMALATLDCIINLAKEKFDMIDEDDQKTENLFGTILMGSYSESNNSSCCASPVTPNSVLPQFMSTSSSDEFANTSYSSPLLQSLRVQAVAKLNPIGLKHLSLPMLPNIGSPECNNLKLKNNVEDETMAEVESENKFLNQNCVDEELILKFKKDSNSEVTNTAKLKDNSDCSSESGSAEIKTTKFGELSMTQPILSPSAAAAPPPTPQQMPPTLQANAVAPVPPSESPPPPAFALQPTAVVQLPLSPPPPLHVSQTNIPTVGTPLIPQQKLPPPLPSLPIPPPNNIAGAPLALPCLLHPSPVTSGTARTAFLPPQPHPPVTSETVTPSVPPPSPPPPVTSRTVATTLSPLSPAPATVTAAFPPLPPALPPPLASPKPTPSMTSAAVTGALLPPSPPPPMTLGSLTAALAPPPPSLPKKLGTETAPIPPPPPMMSSKVSMPLSLSPQPMPLSNGITPPPPPPCAARSLRPKKAQTKLRRSSHMGNLYRILKGKVEGGNQTTKSASGRKNSAPCRTNGKQGMADALAEMTMRSTYFQQIEEDVQKYAKSIIELKMAISTFKSKDMTELIKFHKYVESILEYLTDETQVLARFEGFPHKKLEALRTAAALCSKLNGILSELQNWKIEPPLRQLLDKADSYFNKIKKEIDALERTKDEDSKKFQSHNINFDFNILVQIKESMVDVSSNCMELALKEKRGAKAADCKKADAKMLWRAFQFAFRVYTFAGGHDDRADKLTRELAREIETDSQHQ